MVDQRCRESEGKVKIEGYMSVSDEEAHHHHMVKGLRKLSNFMVDVSMGTFALGRLHLSTAS